MPVRAVRFSLVITCFAVLMGIIVAMPIAAAESPAVRTEKDSYAWKEPIIVKFKNAPGIKGDWVTVVPKETPEKITTKEKRFLLQRRKNGSFTFPAPEKMGQYEVRQYRKDSPDEPVARYMFMVGNPTRASASDKASSKTLDILTGLWVSEQLCGKYNSIKLQLTVTEFSNERYAILRSVDTGYDPERIKFDLYKLGDIGDYDGDFFSPEIIHSEISGSAYKFQIFNVPGKDSIVIDHAICRNFSLSRVIPAEPVNNERPLNSNWQGYVDTCKYINNYPYDIKFSLRELPNSIVVAKAQANFKNTGMSDSYLYGSYDKTKDSISLQGIVQHRNETITLEYAADENRLYGKSEWLFKAGICDYIELSPAELSIEAKSSVPPKTVPQALDTESPFTLTGEWEGDAICGGNPARVLLNIENAPAERYSGTVEYSFAGVLSQGVTMQPLVGEKTQDGNYNFVIDTRRRGVLSTGIKPQGFSLKAITESQLLAVHYDDSTCTDLKLAKRTDDMNSRSVRRAHETGIGFFYEKRRPRERCKIIGEWLTKARNEYSEINFRNITMGQVYPKMVLLFADDEFVPVFGKPYDALSSQKDAKDIYDQVNQICQRDPFNKDLINDFRLVQKFFLGVETNVGSVNGAAIRSIIRQTRRIRNLTDQVKSSLSKNKSLETALQTLEPFKKQIEVSAEFLWPNEKQATEDWITTHLSGYAITKADADFKRISSLPDPLMRLQGMTDLANGKSDYHKYLLEENKKNLRQNLVNAQKIIADSLIGTTIDSIESSEISIPALSKIGDWEDKINSILTLLISDTEQFYRNRIEKKRQEVFESLVSDRISSLETFSADRKGILANSNWLNEFKRSFSGFENRELYQKSVAVFVKTRRKLLRASTASFESDLAKLGPHITRQKADTVLKDYLSWDGDLKMPISLEYLIVTEIMVTTEQ